MGSRKVFYDDSGKEIACYVQANGDLYLEIKDIDKTSMSIMLPKVDAVLFILDLYRKRNQLSERNEDREAKNQDKL